MSIIVAMVAAIGPLTRFHLFLDLLSVAYVFCQSCILVVDVGVGVVPTGTEAGRNDGSDGRRWVSSLSWLSSLSLFVILVT